MKPFLNFFGRVQDLLPPWRSFIYIPNEVISTSLIYFQVCIEFRKRKSQTLRIVLLGPLGNWISQKKKAHSTHGHQNETREIHSPEPPYNVTPDIPSKSRPSPRTPAYSFIFSVICHTYNSSSPHDLILLWPA